MFASKDKIASAPSREAPSLGRIPLSVPQLKLETPEIPGFHCHWMLGTDARITQAKRAGYVFVEPEEIAMNYRGVADDPTLGGNTDMGSQVSVVAGGDTDSKGQAVRLVLMKLRQEWWDEDQQARDKSSDALIDALRTGRISAAEAGERQSDREQRYVDPKRTQMFTKRRA
jgi:hypothetical protein